MKKIPLTRGQFAIVDDDDYAPLSEYKWHLLTSGTGPYYAARTDRSNGQKAVMMHRVINNTPDGLVTDHINGNSLDNRKENLRSLTNFENLRIHHAREPLLLGPALKLKTHCPQGHPYSKENTAVYDHRQCRTCERARARRRYYNKKELSRGSR